MDSSYEDTTTLLRGYNYNDAKRGTDLEIVIARKNQLSPKPLELELWGSPLFAIRQRRVSTENTEGTIFLVGPLDFEAQSMYHLTLLAVDPYVELGKDTRNIAGLEVVVVVQDVQDMPPVFTSAPPITHLPRQVAPGDMVVKVRAEDGDKGAPRQIRYGLVSEGNPFTPFFNINETSGKSRFVFIFHVYSGLMTSWIYKTCVNTDKIIDTFSFDTEIRYSYITYLDENAPQGTALVFNDPYIPQVNDNDAGKNGVFSLSLVGNNGTFEITPTVAERHAQFIIKVRDNTMLDFEARKSVIFQILAQELGPATNLSAFANVTVYLNDVNDNPPVFLALSYDVELPENVTAGTRVVQVAADDVDTGDFGKMQYTAILGYLNTSLNLDPISGLITVATNNHGFDREAMPDLHFLVEARDNDGVGLRVTVPLIIKLLDVNDNPPEFERALYEFVLSPNLNNFTSAAYVKAVDKDAEPPNNVVRYEIIEGTSEGKFAINEETGEIHLLEPLKRTKKQNVHREKRQYDNEQESEVYMLTIRAYDLGVPKLFSTTTVKIYPPESKTRTMSFIVSGANPDRKKLEEVLSTLSGGKVTIVDIKPYKINDDKGTGNIGDQESSQEKSVVTAVVRMAGNTAINVAKLQEQLAKNITIYSNSNVRKDQSSTAEDNNSGIYKAESRLLFWLLILLAILIALVLLLLICCCICEGCPLYMPPRKRVIRVNSTEDDVHLVVRDKGVGRENKSTQNIENKSIEAPEWRRREAWSAEQTDLRTKPTQWKFNKRNYKSKELSKPASTPGGIRHEFVQTAADNDYKYDDTRQSFRHRDGPNIIYTKEMQLQEAFANKHKEYIEDLENGYDRIATLHHEHPEHHERKEQENDSIRRHEIERGSDVGGFIKSDADRNLHDKEELLIKREYIAPNSLGRDQYFIKEGNTEILRLVTRGKNDDERYVNLPVQNQRPVTLIPHTQYVVVDNGKDMLMERFIREQGEEANNIRERMNKVVTDLENIDKDGKSVGQRSHIGVDQQLQIHEYSNLPPDVPGTVPLKSDYLQSALLEMQNKSSIHQELLESSLRKQNELLHQILIERERMLQNQDTASQGESKLETQSLPGHSVMATQTECHIGTQTEPLCLKEVIRKSRSDNDSYSEDESQITSDHSKKVTWIKKKKPKKKIKYKDPRRSIRVYELKRKIKTPIIEESDVSPSLESEKTVKVSKINEREERVKYYGDVTKSTVTKSKNEIVSSTQIKAEGDRKLKSRREVLMEISDSLDEKIKQRTKKQLLPHNAGISKEMYEHESSKSTSSSASQDRNERDRQERNLIFSRQGSSTEEHILDKSDGKIQITDLDEPETPMIPKSDSSVTKEISKKHIENDVLKISDTSKPVQKSLPRYMQWYGKKTSANTKPSTSDKVIPDKPKRPSKTKNDQELKEKSGRYGKIISKESQSQGSEVKKNFKEKESDFIHPRLLKEGRVTPVPEGPLPDVHPLLQHSEHRYEHQYENQNPLCYIQPTHIPKYLGAPPNVPAQRQSLEHQPIYVNQDDVKNKKEKHTDVSESALTHSISISTNYEDDKRTASEVHVSKINIGGDAVTCQRIVTTKVDDNDSGIAMSTLAQQTGNIKRLPITEKKSVFTIAYDDVQTKQLRPDSSSTSY
ncbi:jg16184 [Pararge aegeria aegeria]|uniref:Jg16184 protein n=1 Tax=Pararge aegeria aegeria TaxID=348720 RepID=A0A8S4REE4_9NEOP|nr:jg16184 [Pararge aegeria aegeria]